MLPLDKVRASLCLNWIDLNPQFQKKRKGEPLENEEDLKDMIARLKGRTCLNTDLKRPAMRRRSRENQRNVNLGCVVNQSE